MVFRIRNFVATAIALMMTSISVSSAFVEKSYGIPAIKQACPRGCGAAPPIYRLRDGGVSLRSIVMAHLMPRAERSPAGGNCFLFGTASGGGPA